MITDNVNNISMSLNKYTNIRLRTFIYLELLYFVLANVKFELKCH